MSTFEDEQDVIAIVGDQLERGRGDGLAETTTTTDSLRRSSKTKLWGSVVCLLLWFLVLAIAMATTLKDEDPLTDTSRNVPLTVTFSSAPTATSLPMPSLTPATTSQDIFSHDNATAAPSTAMPTPAPTMLPTTLQPTRTYMPTLSNTTSTAHPSASPTLSNETSVPTSSTTTTTSLPSLSPTTFWNTTAMSANATSSPTLAPTTNGTQEA